MINDIIFDLGTDKVSYFCSLFEFDGLPCVFIARGQRAGIYICAYGLVDGRNEWAIAETCHADLRALLMQRLDVYTAFMKSAFKYVAIEDGQTHIKCDLVSEYEPDQLPAAGAYLEYSDFRSELPKIEPLLGMKIMDYEFESSCLDEDSTSSQYDLGESIILQDEKILIDLDAPKLTDRQGTSWGESLQSKFVVKGNRHSSSTDSTLPPEVA